MAISVLDLYGDYGVTIKLGVYPRKKKKMMKNKLRKLIEISKIVESQIEKELIRIRNDEGFNSRSFLPREKPMDINEIIYKL